MRTQVETPGRTLGFWHEVKVHPGRPEWILAKVRRNICEQWDASTNPQCAYDLFVSQVGSSALLHQREAVRCLGVIVTGFYVLL